MANRYFVTITATAMFAAFAALGGAQTPDGRVPAPLRAKAATEGRVRVIVEIGAGFRPEGRLTDEARVTQRRTIAAVRDAVLTRVRDGVVLRTYDAIPFVALEIDAATLAEMEQWPEVLSVREDTIRRPVLAQSVPLVGAPAAWDKGATGTGWTVAILDTGISASHPFVAGKIVSEACYSTTSAISSSLCPGGVDESVAPGAASSCTQPACHHGMHVAGIAAGRGPSFSGVARDATLLPIQVFSYFPGDNDVGAYDSDILQGLQRVYALRTARNIAAVNLSLGGSDLYASVCDASYPAYKASFDNLVSAGIAPIVASGNAGSGWGISAPACISSAVSVGATTKADQVSDFTNSVGILRLLAPGSSIQSSIPGGGYASLSGTSMAAPHVAGAWAALRSRKPSATHAQILSALESTGQPVFDPLNGLTRPRIRVHVALNALVPILTSVTASLTSPRAAGTPVTWTANVAQPGSHEFRFWLYNQGTAQWTDLRGYAPGNQAAWTPLIPGTYVMQVWVRSIGETTSYESWLSSEPFTVINSPVPILADITVNRTFPVRFGTPITWQAVATGGISVLEYQFWRHRVGSGWTLVQPYSASATLHWTPSIADGGIYSLQVWVRQAGYLGDPQSWRATAEFTILDGTLLLLNSQPGDYVGGGLQQVISSAAYATTATRNFQNGVSVRFMGAIGSGFWFTDFAATNGTLLTAGEFAGATRFPFNHLDPPTPGLSVSGGIGCNELTGRFVVLDVAFGMDNQVERFAADFEQHCEGITPALFGSVRYRSTLETSTVPARVTEFDIGAARTVQTTIPLSVQAIGGAGGVLEYKFWAYRAEGATWSVLRDYGASAMNWTPMQAGTYTLQVWARSVGSAASYESWMGSDPLTIAMPSIAGLALTASRTGTIPIGSSTTWTALASGGLSPLQYKFWRLRMGSGWTMVQDYGTSNSFSWTPGAGDQGNYVFQVWIRHAGSTESYDAWIATEAFAVAAAPITGRLDPASVSPIPIGSSRTFTAQATGGLAPLEYRFWRMKVGVGWTVVQEYSASPTFTWVPAAGEEGTYVIQVWIRSAESRAPYEAWFATDYFTVIPGG
jgi:subtilisin family serine protease